MSSKAPLRRRAALRFLTLTLPWFAAAGAMAQQAPAPAIHPSRPVPQSPMDAALTGADVTRLRALLDAGTYSSENITAWYLHRIGSIDDNGPQLNAIIATFPHALDQARLMDAERAAGRIRGPLHGIPVVIKDNIEVAGPLPTTAGSLALANNVTGRDAPLVARLRAAGAIILAKANLSEWANIRDNDSTSGWSAVGGLTRNPHDLSRTACGSSAGSGAAVAAFLAPLAIGTETDGSITCPAGTNGIVGFKPTVGLVSRTHIIPISHSQDTAGPMTLTVRDAALLLDAIAGSDPADSATVEADQRRAPSYAAALSTDALRGLRIGVLRDRLGSRPANRALVDQAVDLLRAQGAIIVDIADSRTGLANLGEMEFSILMTELKGDMAAYLSGRPAPADSHRTLADLIAFNRATPAEMRWFGQSLFELADTKPALDDPDYLRTRDAARRMAGPDGIDRLRRDHGVDLLLGVSNGPAWSIDLVNGDNSAGPSASQLPAVAGYPHLSVPMGTVEGLPIGLSFIGTAWDDARVLAAGNAFEVARGARIQPGFRASVAP